MSRTQRLLALTLAAVFLGLPAGAKDDRPTEIPYDTPGNVPTLSPDYRQTSHKVVLITDDSLSPRSVNLKEGQLVAWISYSGNPATIVFEREVARDMICHSLVNFSIVEDELKSAPIHPGEFASFCEGQTVAAAGLHLPLHRRRCVWPFHPSAAGCPYGSRRR